MPWQSRPSRRLVPLVLVLTTLLAMLCARGAAPALAAPPAAPAPGKVVAWGENASGQASVPAGLSGVTALAAGTDHSLALKGDGTVVAWGDNFFGQASVPMGLNSVTAITAGSYHSLALKGDGTVVAWGENAFGEASVPAGLSGVTALAASFAHSLALKGDGTVVAWGCTVNFNFGQCTIPMGLSGVTAIAAGGLHSLALKGDGTVVAWGQNSDRQATAPAGLNSVTAIAGGTWHSLAITTDTTAPTVTVNQAMGQADPTNRGPISFTAEFSEPAYGFDASDVTLSGTAGATAEVSGGPTTFTIAVSGMTAGGTVSVAIPAGKATDLAGNPNSASTGTDTTVMFDPQRPFMVAEFLPTGQNGWFTTSPATVTVIASDNLDGSVIAALSCTGGTLGAATPPLGTALTVRAPLSITTQGTTTFSCSATDAAGNTATMSLPVKLDSVAPSISLASLRTADSAPYTPGTPATLPVTATFACSDATSGPVSASVSVTVAIVGLNQTATGTCTDRAGNAASLSVGDIDIPKLGPVPPPPPAAAMAVSGTALLNGQPPSKATVEALVGTTVCGQAITGAGGAFSLSVRSAAQQAGCGTAGAAVTFRLDGLSATGSVVFQSGGSASGVAVSQP